MIATAPTQNPATPTTTPSQVDRAWRSGVIGALNALFVILAIRVTLVISVIGAIILAQAVITSPDPYRLGALAIYAVFVAVPLVWLASRR